MKINLDEKRPSGLNRSERPVRIPIHGYRNVLDVQGQEAGFHYCWVNDYNVDKFLAGEYEFVTHEVTVGHTKVNAGSQVGGKVSRPVGNGVTAFLMRVPDQYYQQDLKALADAVDERESSMKRSLNSGQDGQYGQVSITNKLS